MKNKKNRMIQTILCGLLLINVPASAFASATTNASIPHTENRPTIYIGQELQDIKGIITPRGSTLVPFKPFFDKLNMEAAFDNKRKVLTATSGDTTIILTAGEPVAVVNGVPVQLQQSPLLIDGVMYVNLRFIVETFHGIVFFDKSSLTVIVDFAKTVLSKYAPELRSSIGDTSTQHEPPYNLSALYNEEFKPKTEYMEPTNKWFETNISISAGTHLPGDEVSVQFERGNDKLTYRYQLTERDASLAKVRVIKEEISSNRHFTAKLPDQEGALYLLSVEALGPNDVVEDTLLSLIEVPVQAMNAKLVTDKELYKGNDHLTLTIENFGPSHLFFGTMYTLERYEDGEWHSLLYESIFFTLNGFLLEPNASRKAIIPLHNLPEGSYRIVKEIKGQGTKLSAQLAAYFEVTE